MSLRNPAMHFGRLKEIYKEYDIQNAAQVFNLDDSGFSNQKVSRGRAKAARNRSGTANTLELKRSSKWSSNAKQGILKPAISAALITWNPIAMLLDVRMKK